MVEFALLGAVRASHDGQQVELGRRQERCVLGLLLLEAGKAVPTERLMDLLWGDPAPAAARSTLHSYLARLRSRLSPLGVRLVTRGSGYLADVDPQTVDVHRFLAALGAAQQHADPQARAQILGDALDLWHGPLLGDVADEHLRNRVGARLAEQRLTALELWAQAELAIGGHAAIMSRLTEVVQANPIQEKLAALLMRARYQGGDVAGALAVFVTLRDTLADQLGLEPGRELDELHLAILNRRTPAPVHAAVRVAAAAPPRQLPLDVPVFTGRAAQLNLLDDLLPGVTAPAAGTAQRTVVITAIAGTAGVGKTTLAVHWAHRVSGRFPDGELYVNLRGFDPAGSAMRPEEAVRGFLDALGVEPHRVPAGLQAQSGLFRSLLADKRVLVILDNARDADQVRPLLPGSRGSVVLVTSRNQLTGLVATEGAHAMTLGLLNPTEARQLLVSRLGQARMTAEPQAAAKLIELCAGLPLALAIVAARAAAQPDFGLAALVTDLCTAPGSLDAFTGNDLATDIRAVFSWSYESLSPDAARLFRLMGVHPGPDICLAAAASLAGWSTVHTRQTMDELERAHLVSRQPPGRYSFHDLLRSYARELAAAVQWRDDAHTALHRLLDHYLHTSHRADLLLDPFRDPIQPASPVAQVSPEQLADHQGALSWYAAEHAVLLAVIEAASCHGFDTHAWQLSWTLANYLERRGHWQHWVDTVTAALGAAVRLGDRSAQARLHRSLARADARLGRYDKAHQHLTNALRLYRALDDRVGQAYAHLNINVVFGAQQRHHEALHHATTAFSGYEQEGHLVGQALALNSIGWCHAQLGDFEQALKHCHAALELHDQLGDHSGEADTWDSVGYAYLGLGDLHLAGHGYHRALRLFRSLGDRFNEASTLIRLGDIGQAQGDPAAARDSWKAAWKILDALDHPDADLVRRKLTTPLNATV
ncbi:SARP family transcriptional regulator [Rhizocola hellebori]|uniref:SARP family transcriptional regulator n=1 Tax=Rhizocola hellebori TaxID=1392758 RepID=A0A8J3QFX4_9ACTN|nr:AfsR/SARP family transcriptional regulator [Rhizocola hellebori]GIH08541.1 SARP family transcriptional regulator [Rhizocola hellebori]